MSKTRENIDNDMAEWIRRQKIFFVATAPLAADGHVNTSPKGGEAFRILGPLWCSLHHRHVAGLSRPRMPRPRAEHLRFMDRGRSDAPRFSQGLVSEM